MPNNITALNDDLQKHAEDEAAAYAENFNAEEAAELTSEEKERIAAIEQESSVVVTERNADGTKASIPLSDFAAPLDEKIGSIKAIAGDTEAMIRRSTRATFVRPLRTRRPRFVLRLSKPSRISLCPTKILMRTRSFASTISV